MSGDSALESHAAVTVAQKAAAVTVAPEARASTVARGVPSERRACPSFVDGSYPRRDGGPEGASVIREKRLMRWRLRTHAR
jgi:hypothetical protein